MRWAIALLLVLLGAGAVYWSEERYRWHWRELSLTARLRDKETRLEVFQRVLARLKADYEAGKLQVNEEYRELFERLTADVRSD